LSLSTLTASGCHGLASPASHHSPPVGDLRRVLAEHHPVEAFKGKSALALSRDLDCQYKTAFVLAHKLREAMASELKGMQISGQGETVEVDGGYFGGYVKPANYRENRRDRRFTGNKSGKRQVVVVMRERGGSTLPAVFKSESAAWAGLPLACPARHG
jgi:hypothetical protein